MPIIMNAPEIMQEEKHDHYIPDQALSVVLPSSDYSIVTLHQQAPHDRSMETRSRPYL